MRRPSKSEPSASRATSLGAVERTKTSPPFSTITWRLKGSRSRPTNSATAPATAAMGPTLARTPASIMAATTAGAAASGGSGARESAKRGLARM